MDAHGLEAQFSPDVFFTEEASIRDQPAESVRFRRKVDAVLCTSLLKYSFSRFAGGGSVPVQQIS